LHFQVCNHVLNDFGVHHALWVILACIMQ
jgi:hypothetical protein